MSFSDYLAVTRNRDKVMSVIEFLPLLLQGPTTAIGMTDLAEGLLNASALAGGYRVVTRCSGLVDMLDPAKIAAMGTVQNPIIRKLGGIEYCFSLGFFPMEHLALLGNRGIIKIDSARFGGIGVFCWFCSLTVHIWRVLYEMLLEYPYVSSKARDAASIKRNAAFRRKIIDLVKTLSWWIFSMTCLPANGKPQLLANPSGLLLPLHKTVELLAPNKLVLSTSLRGLLGMIATACDFM